MNSQASAEDDLLCERCGYVLEGLPVEGKCPECGQAIDESLPERRTGTPWQRDRSWLYWPQTTWMTLTTPQRLFRIMRIERGVDLLTINSFAGSLLGIAVASVPLAVDIVSKGTGDKLPAWILLSLMAVVGLFASAIGTVVFEVLSWVERLGIRFYGRKRGWRITRDISHAITNHASIGWFIGAVLTGLLYAIVQFLALMGKLDSSPYSIVIFVYAPLTGLLIGLLTFEILVYIGVRQCRFANTPKRTASALKP